MRETKRNRKGEFRRNMQRAEENFIINKRWHYIYERWTGCYKKGTFLEIKNTIANNRGLKGKIVKTGNIRKLENQLRKPSVWWIEVPERKKEKKQNRGQEWLNNTKASLNWRIWNLIEMAQGLLTKMGEKDPHHNSSS